MAPPTLTAISPEVIPGNGGYAVVLSGTFELDMAYRAYVGPSGDSTDRPIYAGSGKGYDLFSLDGETLAGYLSELVAGSVNHLYVQERDTPANNDSLANALRAIDRDYSTSLWSMKSLFPPNRRMGARGMALLSAPAYPTNYILRSEEFTHTAWSKLSCGVTDVQDDPFGTSRGGVIDEDGTPSVIHSLQQLVTLPADTLFAASVYAKAINRDYAFLEFASNTVIFDLTSGEVTALYDLGDFVAAQIETATHFGEDGWFRASLIAKTSTAGSYQFEFGPSDETSMSFNGASQDSVRVAFPDLDRWCVSRMYRKTEAEAVL